ncbi:prephenate dehydrogenase/arogenate dehydrogenase family protein [Candidatus Woesearchaeota archaeon]|nr:prephenate dehydrogenase/arogenate dehydrogenase family protein [Candidatus Woesearchaeota archaeon]
MKEKIGIIGGKGKMGTWFKIFFENHGFNVLISDKNTKTTNKELVKKSDVVLFSVPIDVTEEIIESMAEYSREDQLWMDVTSIKTPSVSAMLKSKAEVVGMHPMFGHSVKSIEKQTIILCEARVNKWKDWINNLILKNKGKIKLTTPEKHDKIMAIIQGLTHFSLISLGYAFKQLGLDLNESLDYTSPIYRIRLDMVGRILNQEPRLYADIEILNPETHEAMREYIQSIMKLYMIVKDNDLEQFEKYFKEAADFLGEFKKQAMDESNFLIEKLVEKEK